MDKAVQSIQKAVEEAEKIGECSVGNAVIAWRITYQGGYQPGRRYAWVASARRYRDDIRTAVEKARSVSLPADREILHLLPQEFILDDQAGVRDPAGMMAGVWK